MILLDASGLFAALDEDEPAHERARSALEDDRGPFVLSPFVLAELDYARIHVHYSAIRTRRYMYAKYADGERELYDLRRDPNELDNVAADHAYAAKNWFLRQAAKPYVAWKKFPSAPAV